MTSSRRLPTMAMIAVTASVLVAGCQAGDASAPTVTPSNALTPTPSPTGLGGPGILLAKCPGDGSIEFMLIDPATGEKTADHSYHAAQNVVCPNGDGGEVLHFRETFSPDLTKFAATQQNQADGSTTAGYYDLASGAWTPAPPDPGAPTGFGAVPNESNPVFSPTTGDLWFSSGTAVMSATPGSGVISNRQELPGPAASFLLAPGSDSLVLDDRLPNPSGTSAVSIDSLAFSPPNTTRLYDAQGMRAPGPGQSLNIDADCNPKTWISDTKFVCWAGTDGPQIADVSTTGTLTPLLPTNTLHNVSFIGNPRSHNVAFLSAQAETLRLATTDAATPGAQPRIIIDHLATGILSSLNYVILGWTG
jgi:hypothetical protein